MSIFKKQTPLSKIKKVIKKTLKPFRNREFMFKFLTVTMALALLASSVLPYILR